MERAAEVKRSAICFEEHVSGDGSMCAVRVTERAKLDESEAADGIARRSPKPLPADGGGIAKKRPRKPEEPPKEEKIKRSKEEKIKRSKEEKIKRSKNKRAEEKIKQPNNVEVVHGLSMEKVMAKQAKFDKKRADEKRKKSNQEKRMEEMMRMEKIASKTEELVSGDGMKKERRTKKPEDKDAMTSKEQVAGDGMKKKKWTKRPEDNDAMGEVADNEVREVMAHNEAGGMLKKVVTWRLSKELLDYLRTKKVMGLLATDEAPLLPWANKMSGALFDFNQRLKEEIAIEFQKNREFDARVLYQYRTRGYVEIKEEVSDEEDDLLADEKEP